MKRFSTGGLVTIFCVLAVAAYVYHSTSDDMEVQYKASDRISVIMAEPIGNAKEAAEGAKKTIQLQREEQAAFYRSIGQPVEVSGLTNEVTHSR